MSEMHPSIGFEETSSEQIDLSLKCGELLGAVFPRLLHRSDEAQKDLLYQGIADIDVSFLAYDYHVDGLTSYRIRLVPRRQSENQPTFKSYGTVRQVIINIPVDFVHDPRTVNIIDLALVSLYVDAPETTFAQRYVIGPNTIKPFVNFSDLDFNFAMNGDGVGSHVSGITTIRSSTLPFNEPNQYPVAEQLKDVTEISKIIDQLIIGNQSLNDGTDSSN